MKLVILKFVSKTNDFYRLKETVRTSLYALTRFATARMNSWYIKEAVSVSFSLERYLERVIT